MFTVINDYPASVLNSVAKINLCSLLAWQLNLSKFYCSWYLLVNDSSVVFGIYNRSGVSNVDFKQVNTGQVVVILGNFRR